VRYPFADEAAGTTDLALKGDLAESWQSNADARVLDVQAAAGREVAEPSAAQRPRARCGRREVLLRGLCQRGRTGFTFQEIEAIETPDRYTVRVHLKTPNTFFAHNVAEPVTILFAREVLEEDGDLKKRLIGTGPYVLKEHTRKVRVVLARNPD
jgi:peptide/nickel transport system substrate-binding protein